jgi:hypothetical protein
MTPSISMTGEGTGAGVPAANRPPDSVAKSPSALPRMQSSPPAPSPSAVATTGFDVTKGLTQMGQILSQGPAITPVTEPVANQPGNDTNVSSGAGKSGGFPTTGSRAPTQGSAPGKRPMGRVKTR